ncbi:MAG: LysR family transcriptional regulator [Planctomycetota bacterium]
MSLVRLKSLVEIARKGTISAAAKSLHLTQPALSRQIQLLEGEFAVPLLARGPRGASLTEEGRVVEEEARFLLDRYERLKETVRARMNLEGGTVRLGGGATAVALLLPEFIREFRAEHKGIAFHLKEAGSRAIEEAVLREEIELGIVTLPIASKGLEVIPLHEDPIVPVVSRRHALAARAKSNKVPVASLDGEAVIGFEAGSAIRVLIDQALARRGVRLDVVMELRSVAAILRMVQLNLGLAFVSRLAVDASDKSIRELEVPGLRITRRLAVIVRRGRRISIAAEAFLDHLRKAKDRTQITSKRRKPT